MITTSQGNTELLKQPIILALARGLKEKLEPEFEKPVEQGRLLIISPLKTQEFCVFLTKMN